MDDEKKERPEGDEEQVIIPFPPKDETADEAKSQEPEPGELNPDELKGIVEALIFASGSPISLSRLASLVGTKSTAAVRRACKELQEEYNTQRRAFALEEIAGGYQLLTRPDFHTWISKLREKQQEDSLSQAALETLTIVAYRQPITRAQIEDIRGVQSGYMLRSLIEKSLVSVVGRSEELGRPLLYGTTKKFLDAFNLASLKDLPKLEDTQERDDAQ